MPVRPPIVRAPRACGPALALALVAGPPSETVAICSHVRRHELWAFCIDGEPITENAFVRRHRSAVGPSALDAVERPRHRRRWAALGTVLGIGLATIAIGAGFGIVSDDDDTVTIAALVSTAGELLLVVGIPVIVVGARRGGLRRDGSVWDHDITRADARRHIERDRAARAAPRAQLQLAPTALRLRF